MLSTGAKNFLAQLLFSSFCIEQFQNYGLLDDVNSYHPAGIRRRYDVEIWLKIGRQRRQRVINVTLTSFCERWFNISIQTSKQRRYNVRRFDLKFRRCFNVGLTLSFG